MESLGRSLNYIFLVMLTVFTIKVTLAYKLSVVEEKVSLTIEQIILFLMCLLGHGYLIMYNGINQQGVTILGLNILILSFFVYGSQILPHLEPVVWHVVAMLHLIGSIMLHRLEPALGFKHTLYGIFGFFVMVIAIFILRKIKKADRLTLFYIILSFVVLLSVNSTEYGATNWIQIWKIRFQPSEIVKILFAFSLAGIFRGKKTVQGLIKGSLFCGMLVLILVIQRDLGGALLFFVTYIVLSYMYMQKRWLPFVQISGLALASVIAYQLFSHIQVRLISWLHPFDYIDGMGYQITQSLFAFARGKWMGTGLMEGMPKRIPVVNSDFIFAAIGEELGSFFVLLMMYLFYLLIIMLLSQCQKSKSCFGLYTSVGMTVMLGFQGFLIMGGVTKLLPLTGVTFPFVSYGGTSLVMSIVSIGLIEIMSKFTFQKKPYVYHRHTLISLKMVMTILYVILVSHFTYFIVVQSEEIQLNSYNKRLETIEKDILRGAIYDSTGQKLAYSVYSKDGTQRRIYPFDNMYAHVVGYTNPGKTGIEQDLNFQLLNSNQNFFQQLKRTIRGKQHQGSDVYLTLNHNLQRIAEESLQGKKGAIIATDPTTGKILAMVSKPDYNPNTMYQNYKALSEDQLQAPLINRVSQGIYPPGSTFKIITALTYMREHSTDFSYVCTGKAVFNEKIIHCYKDKAHGLVSIKEALAYSCNTAFAVMGEAVTPQDLEKTATDLYFNQKLPYPYLHQQSRFFLPENPSASLRAETVIGQGKTMITPLHNVMITSSIAHGGLMLQPYLVDYIVNPDGVVIKETLPTGYETTLTPEEIKAIREYMVATVDIGTGKQLKNSQYTVAGKTGAAENPFGVSHAWFIGFAPVENPTIAVSIIVENAGSSSGNAVPIAKKLFDIYLGDSEDGL